MFSIFYLSPLWTIGAAILLNDYFRWYNMLNIFTFYEYCLLLALSISIPTASFLVYFGVRNLWEKKRTEKKLIERKKRFDFVKSIANDDDIWYSVTKHVQQLTALPVHCSAYIVEPSKGIYAICITYTIRRYTIGIDTIEIPFDPSQITDTSIINCIEDLYYSLIQESGLRNGIYSFKKIINID